MEMFPEQIASLCAASMSAGTALYLALQTKAGRREWPLLFALLCTAAIELFDLTLRHTPATLPDIKPVVFAFEALLPLGWAAYAAGLSGHRLFQRTARNGLFWAGGILLLILALAPGVEAMFFSPDFSVEPVLFLGRAGFYFYLLLSLFLLTALVMLERAFAAFAHRDRWCLKFEILGLGAIISMQLVYYSQGLLYRTIDMALVPARSGAVVFGLVLLFYSRLRRKRPTNLSLSRPAAFRSVILLAVCIYLIVIGLAGEGLRYLGPSTSRAFIYILALFGGATLCALILSESLRRKTQVFLHKHFYQQKYDYRLLWLKMTERLGQARSDEAQYAAILDMYRHTFAVADAALYLDQGKDGLMLAATLSGLQRPQRLAPAGSLPNFFGDRQWVFNLDDNSGDIAPEDAEQLHRQDIHFIVPLFFDRTLGGVVALGRQINDPEPVIYEDYDLMKIFARQAETVLYAQQLSRQLTNQREMAAVGKVAAFVLHDLKNLAANLSLVVENARQLIGDQRFQQDMIKTLSNTVQRMKGLIGRLKNVGEPDRLLREPYSLKQLVRETVAEIGCDTVRITGDDIAVIVDRSEISKVITNLVRNSLEASNDKSAVQVEVGQSGGPMLICRDGGCGMSEAFMADSLFRPFETTKPQGLGIGLYQCRQIVEAHGGRIEVASAIGQGSEFRVYLPTTAYTEGVGNG